VEIDLLLTGFDLSCPPKRSRDKLEQMMMVT
jgi:hypothetical protein